MTEDELDVAAFWDKIVCLDCRCDFDQDAVLNDTCPNCDSDAVYSAKLIQQILLWLN